MWQAPRSKKGEREVLHHKTKEKLGGFSHRGKKRKGRRDSYSGVTPQTDWVRSDLRSQKKSLAKGRITCGVQPRDTFDRGKKIAQLSIKKLKSNRRRGTGGVKANGSCWWGPQTKKLGRKTRKSLQRKQPSQDDVNLESTRGRKGGGRMKLSNSLETICEMSDRETAGRVVELKEEQGVRTTPREKKACLDSAGTTGHGGEKKGGTGGGGEERGGETGTLQEEVP